MRKLMCVALATASSFAMTTAALAQPAASSSDDATLSEIVVTARRKSESLQSVPQTVNAVTGATLEKLNIQKFEDVQSVIPGLNLSQGNTGFSTSATIRGASFSAESGAQPTVAFYLNDATIQSIYAFESMFDIGQIEVLRGPQGTLRGQSSPSGSITITTRRPVLGEFGGSANLTLNDQGGRNLNGAINAPIIKDVLGFRLAGIIDQDRFDQVRSINNSLRPSAKTWAVRPSLRWEPNDSFTGDVMYQHLERKVTSFTAVGSLSLFNPSVTPVNPILDPEDRVAINDGPNQFRQKMDLFTTNLEYRFAGQKISYVGSISKLDLRSVGPQDNANAFRGIELNQLTHSRAKQAINELRLSSDERLFGMFDYTLGAYASDFNPPSDLVSPTALTVFGNLVATVNTPIQRRGKQMERSLFANGTVHLGEDTELSGGVRKIWHQASSILIVGGNTLLNKADKEDTFVYNASLSHKFSSDFLVYANTGSAFRPGPFLVGVFRPLTPTLERHLALDNEKSKSYELGFKSTMLDKRVLFNAAVFHQDFKNFIYRGPSVYYVDLGRVGPNVNTFNFGSSVDAKIDGLDVDASFQVAKGFNITAAVSYAKSKIKNEPIACNDFNGDGVPDVNPAPPTLAALQAVVGAGGVSECLVNDRLSFDSKWSMTLQSEYARAINDEMDGYVRGLLTYHPKNGRDPYNNYDNVSGYGLLNVYAGVRSRDGAWEVALYAKNLANTQKVISANSSVQTTAVQALQPPTFQVPVGATISSSYIGVGLTPVREIGVNVRYAFGSR